MWSMGVEERCGEQLNSFYTARWTRYRLFWLVSQQPAVVYSIVHDISRLLKLT